MVPVPPLVTLCIDQVVPPVPDNAFVSNEVPPSQIAAVLVLFTGAAFTLTVKVEVQPLPLVKIKVLPWAAVLPDCT